MTQRIYVCLGICKNYATKIKSRKTKMLGGTPQEFTENTRHCRKCNIYMIYSGYHCPCCKLQLRTKSKMRKWKETYKANRYISANDLN